MRPASLADAEDAEPPAGSEEKKRKRVDTYYDGDLVALSAKDDRTLMIRQLHPRTGEFDVFDLFSKAGTVTDVRLITEDRSGKCVGVGYVEMAHVEDVDAALALSGTTVCGNPIVVQHSLAIKNRLSSQGASSLDIRAAGVQVAGGGASGGTSGTEGGGGGNTETGSLKVYVGGLDYSFTEEQVREIFASFGTLERVDLQIDGGTGASRGFAFVHFTSPDEGRRCVEQMDGFSLAGRIIKVSVASNQDAAAKAAGGGTVAGGPPALNAAAAAAAGFAGSLQLTQSCFPMAATAPPPPPPSGGADQLITSLDGLDESVGKAGSGEKLGAAQRASLLMKLAQNAGMEVPDSTRKAAAQTYAYGGVPDLGGEGSRCVVLKNMFDRLSEEASANPNFFSELAEDVRGECAKLGTVLFCGCDRWSNGFVYLKMLSPAEGARVVEVMHGRYFAKNKILASTVPEETLDKKIKQLSRAARP